MKIGYPCINWSLECKGNRTFRLRSYSVKRLKETVENNLDCLFKILKYNLDHNILFFRISSDLIPFASHPVCKFKWQRFYRKEFKKIGDFIKKYKMRISMHPDQFVIINSPDKKVLARSIKELSYHAAILGAIGLDASAKIQLHVGGKYLDKEKSLKSFIERYQKLSPSIKKRLVIENDDKIYNVADCLRVHRQTRVPILFDVFHHSINPSNLNLTKILQKIKKTWKKKDGILMVDYSYQQQGKMKGSHATSINIKDFKKFLKLSRPFDFDIMLEIKDKEKSAVKAIKTAKSDKRFIKRVILKKEGEI
ncbi:MAG: UV DNA damage repair endonuclease UvsE [Candidatus Omnitrophota bacterium]|nr:MAG: UV DNA damage repair endonuclease UvsE [Candidatus Omnitrophota bacterium]